MELNVLTLTLSCHSFFGNAFTTSIAQVSTNEDWCSIELSCNIVVKLRIFALYKILPLNERELQNDGLLR